MGWILGAAPAGGKGGCTAGAPGQGPQPEGRQGLSPPAAFKGGIGPVQPQQVVLVGSACGWWWSSNATATDRPAAW